MDPTSYRKIKVLNREDKTRDQRDLYRIRSRSLTHSFEVEILFEVVGRHVFEGSFGKAACL
ncbi:MAG: hypothetical protein RL235_211 [Chlamydiota bacterium]|jgi:hypothetical protein